MKFAIAAIFAAAAMAVSALPAAGEKVAYARATSLDGALEKAEGMVARAAPTPADEFIPIHLLVIVATDGDEDGEISSPYQDLVDKADAHAILGKRGVNMPAKSNLVLSGIVAIVSNADADGDEDLVNPYTDLVEAADPVEVLGKPKAEQI